MLDCPYLTCPGCPARDASYAAQLAAKTDRLKRALARYPALAALPLEPIVPAAHEVAYRHRAKLPVVADGPGVRIGLFATGGGAGRAVVDTPGCPVLHEQVRAVVDGLRAWLAAERLAAPLGPVTGVDVRHVAAAGACQVTLACKGGDLPGGARAARRLRRAIPGIATVAVSRSDPRGVRVLGAEATVLAGPAALEEKIGDTAYRLTPGAFFQVDPRQAAELVRRVVAAVGGARRIADIYCGVGAYALALAPGRDEVIGIEESPEAVRAARLAAAAAGLEGRVRFFEGRAEDVLAGADLTPSTEAEVPGAPIPPPPGPKFPPDGGFGAVRARTAPKFPSSGNCGIPPSALRQTTAPGHFPPWGNFGGDECVGRGAAGGAALLTGALNAAVLNPARRGSDPATLAAIVRARPPVVVYVSCDPDTLARDLDFLWWAGYRPVRVTPVDLFPQTWEVETVAVLERGRAPLDVACPEPVEGSALDARTPLRANGRGARLAADGGGGLAATGGAVVLPPWESARPDRAVFLPPRGASGVAVLEGPAPAEVDLVALVAGRVAARGKGRGAPISSALEVREVLPDGLTLVRIRASPDALEGALRDLAGSGHPVCGDPRGDRAANRLVLERAALVRPFLHVERARGPGFRVTAPLHGDLELALARLRERG